MQRNCVDNNDYLRHYSVNKSSRLDEERAFRKVLLEKRRQRHTMPERMPPDPRPATALPRMKAIEFGAAPQRAEPASNSKMDVKKVALMLKILYSFPNTS